MAYIEPKKKIKLVLTPIPATGTGTAITFEPVYIQNLSFDHSPSWNQHMDMGRADPKVMYNQFNSSISLSWWVVAFKKEEVKSNIAKLNSVSQMTKPTYLAGSGFNGVYCKIEIGTFVSQYGYIESLRYSIDEDVPWDDDRQIYINCDMTLNVLQSKRPDYNDSTYSMKS